MVKKSQDKETIKRREELVRQLLDAILDKYGTQKELAKAMGVTEGNLSKRIKNPSRKFVKELENHGVKIYHNNNKNIVNNTGTNSDLSNMVFNLIQKVGQLEEKINRIEKRE
ncbi:MAG: hypothetical protein WC879_13010 [Melioribacteraceae bacterium]